MAELPVVSPGEIIASAHINNIAARSVQRYTDASERDALSPTPAQGELAYLEDTSEVLVFSGAVWVVGGAAAAGGLKMSGAVEPVGDGASGIVFQWSGGLGFNLQSDTSGDLNIRRGAAVYLRFDNTGDVMELVRQLVGTVDVSLADVLEAGETPINGATSIIFSNNGTETYHMRTDRMLPRAGTGTQFLGDANNRWQQMFATTASNIGSRADTKDNLAPLSGTVGELIDAVTPMVWDADRVTAGFTVEMFEEFGTVGGWTPVQDDGLIYTELVVPLWAEVQDLRARVAALEG